MPVPPECASLEQEINQLTDEINDWPTDAHGHPSPGLTSKVNLLAQKKAALVGCISQHAPGYETLVSVLDFVGTTTLPYQGVLWHLAPAINDQTILEAHSVQAGKISFAGTGSPASGGFVGVSINDGANTTFLGPLFRSGPLLALPAGAPANPSGEINITVPPAPPPVSLTTINSMLPSPGTVIPTSPPVTIIPPVPTITLGPGTAATLTLNAAISVPILGVITVPFMFVVTFTITPSSDMIVVTRVCDVTATKTGTLTTTLGGLTGYYFNLLFAPSFAPSITDAVVAFIRDSVLNPAILAAAAGALGLNALPPGMVVSMRRVAIIPGGITPGIRFFPSLGSFGP